MINDECGMMNGKRFAQSGLHSSHLFIIHHSSFIISLLLGALCFCNLSCNVFGIVAQAMPPDTIKPQYNGLAGQSIGVMVWTDRGVSVDFPDLSLDLANSIQHKLILAAGQKDEKELKGSTFPVKPASILRYEQDHADLDITNIADIAPHLGVSRLIYVEVDDFGTRAEASVDLFRGHMATTMKVIEVTPNGTGKIAYSEDDIKATYPPSVNDDGTPNGDDGKFYAGTVDAMSTQIVWRLVSHEAPSDEGDKSE
jgi:hypothetical protein